MNHEIVRLTAHDFQPAMDFINMVFSMSSRPHHFQSLLPKLYQADDEKMKAHFAIRRDGRIRAIIGHYPMTLCIGTQRLKASGIGAVSTHPEERQSGMMRQLMEAVTDHMREENIALSVLGGQRQRYGYYGYEIGGTSLLVQINQRNLKHFFRGQSHEQISFETAASGETSPSLLQRMKGWHDRELIHVARPADEFLTILESWYAKVWIAHDPSGQAIGYLVTQDNGAKITELICENPEQVLPVVSSWVEQQDVPSVELTLAPWQVNAIADLGRMAERYQVRPAYQFSIQNWPTVLSSLLKVRSEIESIPDGTVHLGIEDHGQVVVYELSHNKGQTSCVRSARNTADIMMDRLTATRLTTGPLPPSLVVPQRLPQSPALRQLLSAWFPLPLSWSVPDKT